MRLRRQWRASAKLEVCDPSPLRGKVALRSNDG